MQVTDDQGFCKIDYKLVSRDHFENGFLSISKQFAFLFLEFTSLTLYLLLTALCWVTLPTQLPVRGSHVTTWVKDKYFEIGRTLDTEVIFTKDYYYNYYVLYIIIIVKNAITTSLQFLDSLLEENSCDSLYLHNVIKLHSVWCVCQIMCVSQFVTF